MYHGQATKKALCTNQYGTPVIVRELLVIVVCSVDSIVKCGVHADQLSHMETPYDFTQISVAN